MVSKVLKYRVTAVWAVLAGEVAGAYNGRRTQKRPDEIEEILERLVVLGQIEEGERPFLA